MSSVRHLTAIALAATALAGLMAVITPAAAWEPVEQVKTYSVSGQSGAELYQSIGGNGPEISGGRRAIAHTTFKLTWRRDYQNRAGDCVLASAKPRLIITYTLPKPKGALPAAVAQSWKRFADGLAAHERVHGEHIIEMVRAIEAVSIGLSAADDADCNKVRAKLQTHLKQLSNWQRQRGRDFDRVEMGDGGAVHQLVLALVNGP
jgi:predicted secreted Zn-dependent protease